MSVGQSAYVRLGIEAGWLIPHADKRASEWQVI